MSKLENGKSKQVVVKATTIKVIPIKNIVEREQFDKDGNLVCPACKKSLRGLITHASDSLIAPNIRLKSVKYNVVLKLALPNSMRNSRRALTSRA
jgi:hypothetical protein